MKTENRSKNRVLVFFRLKIGGFASSAVISTDRPYKKSLVSKKHNLGRISADSSAKMADFGQNRPLCEKNDKLI